MAGCPDEVHCVASGELWRNTYVVIEGCLALRNHLDMRRVLLEDAELREEYTCVKSDMEDVEFEHTGSIYSCADGNSSQDTAKG